MNALLTGLTLVGISLAGSVVVTTIMFTFLYWTGFLADLGLAPAWYRRRHPSPAQTSTNATIYIVNEE